MKICRPYKSCKPTDLTQGFSKEHQANDWGSSYGTFLVAPFNSKVISIITAQNIETTKEELTRGYGVRLASTENPKLTMTYWHCLPVFPVKVGDIVLMGQPVAQMGNSGFVTGNGKYIEIDIRTLPPYPGTHVHWSMGEEDVSGKYVPLSPHNFIDWNLEIKYDVLTTIKAVLQNIINFLKK